MATVTHRTATPSTINGTSYLSGSFTPAAGELIVVFTTASDTTAVGTMTDSQGLGFSKIASALKNTSLDTIYLFVSNTFAAASAMTVTFDCTGDAATGSVIHVASVSGMLRTGLAAVRQTAKEENMGAAGTPAPSFSLAALTGNPTLGCVGNSTNPATLTEPSGWTEGSDNGYNTPTTGSEYVFRNSGFTGQTITWQLASVSAYGDIIVELDTSPPPVGTVFAHAAHDPEQLMYGSRSFAGFGSPPPSWAGGGALERTLRGTGQ